MNTLIQTLSSLALARIETARARAESLVNHVAACAAPLETLAREAKLLALTRIETLLRQAGAPTTTIEREIRAQSESKIASLEERVRQLEAELALARQQPSDAQPRKLRTEKSARRKTALTQDAPRLDA